MRKYSAGILVVSDSCSNGTASDQSGLNLQQVLVSSGGLYEAKEYAIVPDQVDTIKAKLIEWSDELHLDLILTTGGSGFSPTDVTPEATRAVIHKEAASISNTILLESLKITKFAMLSRAVAGIRNDRTLIINLPGSKKGAQEGLEIVLPVLKHALDLMNDHKEQVKSDHVKIQSGQGAAAEATTAMAHNHIHHQHHNHHHHHHLNHGFHQQHHPHHRHINHNHQQHVQAHLERHQQNLHSCSHSISKITHSDIVSKPRESPFPMISVDEAMSTILAQTEPLGVEELNYLDALGHICAENVYAEEPLPPFAASVKDGFAVKLTSQQRNAVVNSGGLDQEGVSFEFSVIGASNAGDQLLNIDMKEGECVKINTGAPVPLKADLVIQIEDTESVEKDESGVDTRIRIVGSSGCGGGGGHKSKIGLKLGQDIRPIGSDIQKGELVVRERMIIKPAQVGICATVGCVKLKCYKKPSVALISTGNELVSPGDECSQGKIRDANKSLLHAALKSYGIHDIYDAGIAKDEPTRVLETFKAALANSDVVISTGGVSMGDKDLVKDVLEKDLACQIHFARMNMKPGKPTTFASCLYEGRKKLLFCLPGNPVSSIVTFNLVVVPCIKKLMGHLNPFFNEINVKINFGVHELDPRPEYHRCYLQSSSSINDPSTPFVACSTGNQHSSRLMSMSEANCLVKLPGRTSQKSSAQPGEIYKALLIDSI